MAAFTGVLQLATSILLYRLVRSTISEMAGILAACFWAFNTYVLVFLYKTGVESSITLFLLLLLLHGLRKLELNWRTDQPDLRTIAGLALISVLIAFGRLDLAFFSMIVGLWIVFRATPARYLLPLDILAFACAAVSAFLIRLGFVAYYEVSTSVQVMLLAALACKLPILYFMGLYTKPTVGGVWRYLGRLLLGVTAGSITLAIILFGGTSFGLFPIFSRAVLLVDLFISLGLLLVIRLGALAFSLRHSKSQAEAPGTELRMHWRRWLREGVLYYGIVGGALSSYMLWNKIAFGTTSPVSGQIKHWWATFIRSIYGSAATSWLTFFAVNPFSDFNAWAPLTSRLSDWSNRLLYAEGRASAIPAGRPTSS